jgi:hypothetical protein
MLSASELRFSSRQRGELPAWVSNGVPGPALRIWALSDAKTVTLLSGGESVLVQVRERSSLFVGEISGFQPSSGMHFQGLHVGDLIVFKEEHIFDASP